MTPRFGDLVTNLMASPENPTRTGRFVKAGRRTGRMNPGPWWELTDGRGNFWQVKPANCEVAPGPQWVADA